MTEALASRVAGLKLGGIVGVLLLPMLVLSFLMVSSLREDMASARREMLGVSLNRLVIPVAISAASGQINEEAIAALRQKGRPLSDELGVRGAFNSALADLITYTTDPRFSVEKLAVLLSETATASNITLDPLPESYFLGTLTSREIPSLLADFSATSTVASRTLMDKQVTWEESAALLLATGAWVESQKRVADSLQEASVAYGADNPFAPAIERVAEMDAHPQKIARILTRDAAKGLASQLSATADLGTQSTNIVDDIAMVWNFSLSNFENLVQGRIAAMQLRLYALLGIAALACLIGVGGSALMFRSTLKQLDHVKKACDQADDARVEAELATEEVRRINEEVVKLNSDLARNFDMLRDAQDEALRKGKMAQLGQLTATVAHELRNPLGAVRTSTFLLERKVKGKGLGIEAQLERINNGVTRCDNIISQLLDFARTKALQLESLGFDEWLSRLVEEEAQMLPAAVAIECQLAIGDRKIPFDPARMGRAVINIINNASEAMVGKGEDPSKFATKVPVISLSTELTARGVELKIADNGPGMAPEVLAKIFEPLFTTKNFGTGLGLPAVQKILEQHGGGLDVASTVGRGTCFTAWWPAETEMKEAV